MIRCSTTMVRYLSLQCDYYTLFLHSIGQKVPEEGPNQKDTDYGSYIVLKPLSLLVECVVLKEGARHKEYEGVKPHKCKGEHVSYHSRAIIIRCWQILTL